MGGKKSLTITRYNTEISQGLSAEQIKERQENKLVNKVKNNSEKTYLRIIFDNVFTLNCFLVVVAI